MSPYDKFDDVNPDDYVPTSRQTELIDMAEIGMPFSAIRIAIREAVFAAANTTYVNIEVCDGSCIDTGLENQCESCADLEMRMMLGIVPTDTQLMASSEIASHYAKLVREHQENNHD